MPQVHAAIKSKATTNLFESASNVVEDVLQVRLLTVPLTLRQQEVMNANFLQ